ncbi:MAG: hypothetical protein IKJ69_06250 [Clostridia bacterium]|nr:hypothetical protein [Clostridia bacterium]
MDVKLFSLYKQETPEIEAGKQAILDCAKSFFPDCEKFNTFASQKRMLLAVSQSLRAADVVIVAVQGNMYNATKKLLTAALDLKTTRKADVAKALRPLLEKGKIKQNIFETNIRFPQGAEIMPTENYLHCGFTLTAGGQHIIYLPIENPRADEVVLGSLYDFLADICEEDCSAALALRHTRLIEKAADKLSGASFKAAFSGDRITKHIKAFSSDKNTASCFICDENEKSYSYLTDDEIIKVARSLRDDNYADFGVIVSDVVENENSERCIAVAIADENGTSTLKIFAENDETTEHFVAACADKVMLTLSNFEKLSASGSEETATKADKKLRNNLFKITSGVVGASAIISLIIALIMK